MKTIKPFQVNYQSQVIEQDNKFYFVVSATIGSQLRTGDTILVSEWMADAMEGMGESPMPDPGMPKPSGEFLVSGNYHSPNGTPVMGGEIKLRVGSQEKDLLVFGPRRWENGLPSKPEVFTSMAIGYQNAFGGSDFNDNPYGIGFMDDQLPCIESSRELITSPKQQPNPAGFSVLNPAWPQRVKYQGTYDEDYLKKYFPGLPGDFDWRYFHCAPQDQWHSEYYKGDESYDIYSMHPEHARLSGTLPGLHVRCFLNRELENQKLHFSELKMNLDTIWLFPEQELVLQTWRATVQVADDDVNDIKQCLFAYERQSDPARSVEHYENALLLRLHNEDDGFLNNFKTQDLIPLGDKTAMALLFENALSDTGKESELSKNLTAKVDVVQEQVNEQMKASLKELKEGLPENESPELLDLKKIEDMLTKKGEAQPDTDVDLFKARLEQILPGITKGDPKKIDFSNFSFSDIDKIMVELNLLMDKKQSLADESLAKMNVQLEEQLSNLSENVGDTPDEEKEKLAAAFKKFGSAGKEEIAKPPLPRVDTKAIIDSFSQVGPQTTDAMQQLAALKNKGVDDEYTKMLEEMINTSMGGKNEKLKEQLGSAKKDFRELYMMSAHLMDEGAPPHKDELEKVRQKLLDNKRDAAEKDWAGIDLSQQNLDGIDLSGCFLEQVNFSGASLIGANFSGAIMARSTLDNADFTGADLQGSNIGAVHAHNTNFTDANLSSAKLTKGDFTGANFTRAKIVDLEALEIVINRADFSEATMSEMKFIEVDMSGVKFDNVNLTAASFLKCKLHNCRFPGAVLTRCTWADTRLSSCIFDRADLSHNCFVSTEEEFMRMEGMSFEGANLTKCNFQSMSIIKGNFRDAQMEGAIFNGADLTKADLQNALAKSTQFRGAKLTHAKMDNINLMEGSLAKAHLSGASLKNANLYAVDFLRSTMGETDFSGSYLEATLIRDWRPS
jgi:uncharacterized protein YjbI with pentapeptide repeats